MKQKITLEQLNELSEKGREKLKEWVLKKKYHENQKGIWIETNEIITTKGIKHKKVINKFYYPYPLLSIGQMIEFLDENDSFYALNAGQKLNIEYNKGDKKHINDEKFWAERDMSNPYNWQCEMDSVGSYDAREPVDALWEAVKEVLDKLK